jgi:putative peptidoglycan lipid II flippase
MGAPTGGRTLVRNNLSVAGGTLLSRVTGLVRTVLLVFAVEKSLGDVYLLANNTPNIIYELILGGVLTATLVPIFTEDIERGDDEATAAVITFTIAALGVLTVLAILAAPLLMLLYGTNTSSGISHAQFLSVGIKLAVLLAPQVFFYGLMALWSAVLNARGRFFAAAWAPVLNNLVVIGVLIATWKVYDKPSIADGQHHLPVILALGLGTTAGIAVMALALYPALRRSGLHLHWHFDLHHPAVARAVRLSGWTFGYVVANQVAVQVVNILATPGSGGVRDYLIAYQFFQLPHGLLAVSIMTTFEPILGRASARRDWRDFNQQLLLGLRLIGLLIIPAAIGYIAIPAPLGFGTLGTTGGLASVLRLTAIVAAFAAGLPGFSAYLFALRGFYALKDTRTPFYLNCVENLINIATAVPLVHAWGIVGLALSFSISYLVAAVLAFAVLLRRSPGFDLAGLLRTVGLLAGVGAVMGGVVLGVERLIGPSGDVAVLATIVIAMVAGMVTYVGGVNWLRVPGIDELLERMLPWRYVPKHRARADDQP